MYLCTYEYLCTQASLSVVLAWVVLYFFINCHWYWCDRSNFKYRNCGSIPHVHLIPTEKKIVFSPLRNLSQKVLSKDLRHASAIRSAYCSSRGQISFPNILIGWFRTAWSYRSREIQMSDLPRHPHSSVFMFCHPNVSCLSFNLLPGGTYLRVSSSPM